MIPASQFEKPRFDLLRPRWAEIDTAARPEAVYRKYRRLPMLWASVRHCTLKRVLACGLSSSPALPLPTLGRHFAHIRAVFFRKLFCISPDRGAIRAMFGRGLFARDGDAARWRSYSTILRFEDDRNLDHFVVMGCHKTTGSN